MKTKIRLSSNKTLLLSVLATALALPGLHASSLTSESPDRLGVFGSTSDSEWFSRFANFQSSYTGFFSLSAFSLPRPAGDVLAVSPVVGPMISSAGATAVSASPLQLAALAPTVASTPVVTAAPVPASQPAVTSSEEPVFRTISVPAETAADGSSTMQPRSVVITPPAPTNKPVFSNL